MFVNKKTILRVAALIALVLVLSGCGGGTLPPPCTTDFLIVSINNANNNGPGTDTIELAPGCVYELGVVDNTIDGNNGLPSITSSIVINGNGATIRRSTLSQKAAIRLFHISQGGDLVLNSVTLLDGMGMEPVNVLDPIRNAGGAIFNYGVLTVNNSLITANRAKLTGGGIYNAGTMTINNTTLDSNGVNIGNEPGESGGAILNTGTATVLNSTISNNIASQSGGGIGNSGTMTITNSTISGNSTTLSEIASGAAIMNSGHITVSYTTIANNTSTTAGAVFSAPDTIEIHNTIIADNPGGDCSYPPTSMILGPNISSDGSCGGMITDDPKLDPLANNGGPTQTHAIAANSPARDLAFGLCPAADQRGDSRPHGSACDIGAYEFTGGGPSQSDPSVLTGFVFDDLNADGVKDPGESPFAGVKLVLGDGPCTFGGLSQTNYSASDGSFQFNLLPPSAGTYCISIDPLNPPNDTILIPGGFTVPIGGKFEITLTEGEDISDILFGWDFQFSGLDLQPNPVITNVVLSTTTPPDGGWVEVEVTIENQGAYPAENYELVLIPHYGWGPPNPGGYVVLPTLMPGVPHTEVFSPGVIYSPAGTYTLRVLVTDDWYALGDPDSTGTNGDYQDFPITVTEAMSFCDPFFEMELSLVVLPILEDIKVLPLYLKTEGGVIPGLTPPPDDGQPWEYYATLGDHKSNSCGLQGFEDRLYCMFTVTPEMAGSVADFSLYLGDCENPVYTQLYVSIPEMKTCTKDLGEADCKAAGGTMSTGVTTAPYCICP